MIKPIDEYDGYFISDDGKVFCNLDKDNRDPQKTTALYEVKTRPTKNGHQRVYARNRKTNRRNDLYVHRLVGWYFLPKPDGCNCINHKNCYCADNRAVNLEWCTVKQNSDQTLRLQHLIRNERNGRFIGNFDYREVLST